MRYFSPEPFKWRNYDLEAEQKRKAELAKRPAELAKVKKQLEEHDKVMELVEEAASVIDQLRAKERRKHYRLLEKKDYYESL